MANIVISRIQHRRGRRENLPQPLLPAEVALTSDTSQAWIGQDPALAVASVNVYSDKLEATAQSIIDNQLVESKFDADFAAGTFATMVTELKGNATVTLTDADILWDNTFRGEILSITIDIAGTGFNVGDAISAISATGSGFVGSVATTTGGPGTGIATVTITSGGQNYQYTNTTFSVAGGGSGETLSVAVGDIHGSTVHIAADVNVDSDNTVANIITEVAGLSAPVTNRLISSAAYVGTFTSNSMLVNNHVEAANVASLINRVNSTTPGEITGLTYTNLNIEITGGTNAGAVVLPYEAAFFIQGISLAASDFKGLHVVTQDVTFASGVASEAYANIVDPVNVETYDLQKNGVSFGSVSFAISANVGTVTIGSSTSFTKGDRLEIFGPVTPGGTMDQVAITLTGTITV